MSQKYGFALVLIVVLGLMATAPFAAAQDDADAIVIAPGDEVIIGVATILSGEGLAPLGEDILRGIQLAQEDRPVIAIGDAEFPVVLDVQDSQCSAEGGQLVANRFVSDQRIVAVNGPVCSSACTSAAPIFDAADYTMISPGCTAPALSTSGFTSFNRNTPSDIGQGTIDGQFLAEELGARRLAIIHDGSPYGEGLVNAVADGFTAGGGELVASDAVNVGDTDFRGLLEDIAESEPDAIFFGGFPAEGARLAQQRFDAGLDEVIFMSGDGNQTPEFVELAGNAAEGVYLSAPAPISSEAYDAFLERYEETFNTGVTGAFHANGFDGLNMILDAVEAVAELDEDGNLVISRAAIREFIRSIQDFEGLTGELNCDGTGECASANISIYQVQDGVIGLLETRTG